MQVKVSGQTTFNTINSVLRAACDGHGLALVPERLARPHLNAGGLPTRLDAFCPSFPGFHLYYPSRQRSSSAFEVVLEALREKA
ncbi:LysR substrate-binding domain-containing protein [Mameliella alba]|uniref:LysR substrate-binding domain-containing protein n=1 Tax=Mameliella alba TaxID=561184 RepID=UPI0031597A4C